MNTFAPVPQDPDLMLGATVVTPLPVVDAGGSSREWTVAMVETSARNRGVDPESRLLAVFDVLNDLFNRADREARTFVETLSSMTSGRALNDSQTEVLTNFRELMASLATEARLTGVAELTLSLRVLMKGAIVRAVAGDLEAGIRARDMAVDLVTHHRAATPVAYPVAESAPSLEVFDFDSYVDEEFDPSMRPSRPALAFAVQELSELDYIDDLV